MKRYCDGCGITHTSIMCFNKPRSKLKTESDKAHKRKQNTNRAWFILNPPDDKGVWICYLQISPDCPVKLTESTITLEHVKSKARHPESKYDVYNLKPACRHCNKLKGSMSEDEARAMYGKIES